MDADTSAPATPCLESGLGETGSSHIEQFHVTSQNRKFGAHLRTLIMVICIVVGCSKRSDRNKLDVSFYRIPSVRAGRSSEELELSKKRRDGFLAAISRADLAESKLENGRICSRHFISRKPVDLFVTLNPDWLPTLNLGHSKVKWSSTSEDRYQRKRSRVSRMSESTGSTDEAPMPDPEMQIELGGCDAAVQTEESGEHVSKLHIELNFAYAIIHTLEDTIRRITPFTELYMEKSSDKFVQHYTGLPNFRVLKSVYDFVAPKDQNTKLSPFQEFMATMIKLQHNPSSQDLAYRFDVSSSTVSRILLKWLTALDVRLKSMIVWPERDDLRRTMPHCFRQAFRDKVAVVVDCFEVFVEWPSNLLVRSLTWSSYKHHNTVKLLIGITPQGSVSYISESWEGRVSDKYLTEHCGIFNNLLPGHIMLADRGFDIYFRFCRYVSGKATHTNLY